MKEIPDLTNPLSVSRNSIPLSWIVPVPSLQPKAPMEGAEGGSALLRVEYEAHRTSMTKGRRRSRTA